MLRLQLPLGLVALCAWVGCSKSEGGQDSEGLPTDDSGMVASLDAGQSIDAGPFNAGPVSSDKWDSGTRDGGRDGGGTTAALTKLPCDIERIVSAKCGTCHGADPSAPMSLTTATDFQRAVADRGALYTIAKQKITATDPRERMPPVSNEALTADELMVLTAWLDKGAPGSDETCTEPGPKGPVGGYQPDDDSNLTCYRFLAHNGDGKTPLNLGIALDAYYAYVFAAPWKETQYGVVVRSVTDNKKALHHWLLFQDNLPGIPTGAVPQIGAHPTGQLLAVWAPGGTPLDLRGVAKDEGGVAIELPADATYTVEFHYNSDDINAVDHSGVEVCVAKEKPKNIAAYSWLGYDNVAIPSMHWQGTCRPLSLEPIHLISFMPHMHYQGLHMTGTINRSGGSREVVHDDNFDFNYQKSYPVNHVMNPGDSLTVDCRYAIPSVFGQPTNLEMCYLFTLAYPKGALASLDVWGTVAHGSSSCLGQ
jgi:Copper type II ascorbate-dependent monooxygenase, C-terminal domain